MEQVDLVIGAVTGYNWDQIKYWANSLDRSGFTGKKAVLAFNMDKQTVDELTQRNYHILAFNQDPQTGNLTYPRNDFSIVVERFLHYYSLLDSPTNRDQIRYVIATDVRDVVFQTDPSKYLDFSNLRAHELVLSSESIAYKDEPWGANNLRQSFGPLIYDRHKDNTIINCGVLAGKFGAFIGLSKLIWLMCMYINPHIPGGGGPDQAALNLILSAPAFDYITEVNTTHASWAAQLGTTMDPRKIEAYKPFLKDPQPIYNPYKKWVETPFTGTPYAIVHQWDRVPEIKAAFEELYS